MIKKYGIYLLVIFLLIVASVMIYIKLNPKELPNNLISATGNMDADLILLNTKYAGRIKSINVEDGQKISIGETIATIKSDELQEQLKGLRQRVASAKNKLKAMQEKLKLMQLTIPLNIKKAKKAIDAAVFQEKEVEDSIKALKDVVAQNKKDYIRAKTLFEKNLIARQKMEYAHLKFLTSKNKLFALKDKKSQAKKGVDIAQSNYALAKASEKDILALQANVLAAKNEIQALVAKKKELEIVISKLVIKSPINGFVVEKIAQKGEVLNGGMPIATLVDPKTLYLKVFVDTINNGKIKIGDKAVIFLDSYPNKPIKASVVNIASRAEFTPKEVSVKSDRIQRVYALHLKPLHTEPLLKLGIPAVGVISIDGKGLPSSLNDIPVI